MSRAQWISVFASLAFLLILFYGFDLKEPGAEKVEKKRAVNAVFTSVDIIRNDAIKTLSGERADFMRSLEGQMEGDVEDAEKIKTLKSLSAAWYDLSYPILSGHYAEEIAKIEQSAEAWAIAGSTYFIALKNTGDKENRQFARGKAVNAYERAISLDADNMEYKVNLALTYTEMPDENEPMKGVMMLLDMNKNMPENIPVLKALARLGMRTGQYEKAKQRLEKITELDPKNVAAWCMLTEVYQRLNEKENELMAIEHCRTNND